MYKKFKQICIFFSGWVIFLPIVITGCATTPPKDTSNLCKIFYEKEDWYDAAADMRDKWGVPIHVPMAMMYQESSFRHDALPPRDYILFGLIPWGRVSSAYGYSQAKTPTWSDYVRETGNTGADRDDFEAFEAQREIEASDKLSFSEFITDYFAREPAKKNA